MLIAIQTIRLIQTHELVLRRFVAVRAVHDRAVRSTGDGVAESADARCRMIEVKNPCLATCKLFLITLILCCAWPCDSRSHQARDGRRTLCRCFHLSDLPVRGVPGDGGGGRQRDAQPDRDADRQARPNMGRATHCGAGSKSRKPVRHDQLCVDAGTGPWDARSARLRLPAQGWTDTRVGLPDPRSLSGGASRRVR